MDEVICGIDPGLGVTGYAVIESAPFSARILDAGVCRFSGKESLAARLASLHGDMAAIFDDHRPALVAVEQLYSHYNQPRTAILMGHARGVILLAAAQRGIEVRSYSATRIKRFLTGNGRATKPQMQRAIQVSFGLSAMPEPHDVADALAVALCAGAELGANRSLLSPPDRAHPLAAPRQLGRRGASARGCS